jgi:LysR family transcriptional regulator, transcriptional activator of the cysJI operon
MFDETQPFAESEINITGLLKLEKLHILMLLISKTTYSMINIVYLKYFYDTIRLESVSKAAQHNYVTQSAVSQGIVKLEQTFKAPLLIHKRNTIKITSEGKKVFGSCRSIFQTIDQLIQSVQQREGEYSGQLAFSCSHSVALSLLPEVLMKLHANAPKVIPQMVPGHIKLVKEWLRQGKIEFGVVLENEDVSSLERIPLYSGTFKLYQSINRKKEKSFDAIISTEDRPEVNAIKDDFFRKYGIKLKTCMEVSSWEIIANLTFNDVGIGFFPDFLALSPQRLNQLIPCSLNLDPIPYSISVIFNKGEELSRNAKLLVAFFQECLTQQQL